MQVDAWKTPPEIAALLRVKPETVRTWIERGELPAVNIGSGPRRPRLRIDPEAFEAFLRRRAIHPKPKPGRRRKSAEGLTFF